MDEQNKENKSNFNLFLFSETKNVLNDENAKKTGFLHSLIKPIEVALLGSGVLAAFLVGMLFKPILDEDQLIVKNFNNLTATLRGIQLNTDKINRACRTPVNEAEASEYQDNLGNLGVNLVNVFHDDLGHLISPQTFCALREVTSSTSKSLNSKNPCDNVPRFSKNQINNIMASIDRDKNKINIYMEVFYKKRNQTYTDNICEEKTE